jgi:hypothetical protein
MFIFSDQLAIDEESLVVRFRRDRRRRSRSPLGFARRNVRYLAEPLQGGVIGMAGYAGAFVFGGGRGRGNGNQQGDKGEDHSGDDSRFHMPLLRESLRGSLLED